MENPGSNVQRFDPSDTSTVCSRWKKWKRGFEIFLDVNNVTVPARKRSYLLHFAGADVQDIFFNLRGDAEPEIPVGSDIYQESVQLLDAYFLPLKCLPRERHIFRNLAQAPDESIEKFVLRLREQGALCEYDNWLEENIKEQIFEKGASDHLRAKILTKPNMTLAETVELGRSLETIAKHQNSLVPEEAINRVSGMKGECFRCGQTGHYASSEDCPARNQKCDRCQLVGHFKRCCNTKLAKPRNKVHQRKNQPKKDVRRVADKEPSDQSDESSDDEDNDVHYVFATGPAGAEKVSCCVGGVKLLWMVDSGTSVNVISEAAWEFLKESKVKVDYQTAQVTKKLMAYGNHPLEVKGMFTANIATKWFTIKDRVFVVKEGGSNLLGRSAATKLGILKIDRSSCAVQQKEGVIGKVKRVAVAVQVDQDVKPVQHTKSRISIPLLPTLEKVLPKSDELCAEKIPHLQHFQDSPYDEAAEIAGNEGAAVVPVCAAEGRERYLRGMLLKLGALEEVVRAEVKEALNGNRWIVSVEARAELDVVSIALPQFDLTPTHVACQGVDRAGQRLRGRIWWPNAVKGAESSIGTCPGGRLASGLSSPELLSVGVLAKQAWHTVAALGSLPYGCFNGTGLAFGEGLQDRIPQLTGNPSDDELEHNDHIVWVLRLQSHGQASIHGLLPKDKCASVPQPAGDAKQRSQTGLSAM